MVSAVSDATDRCGSCGNDLRAKARFCDVCGSPVSPRSATGEHKQVTVLFADVVGSMKLAAALDVERLQEIMNELFNRAAAVVQRYQGTLDKFTGDGLMALFGAPIALEDHALRACISALEIQSVTKELAAEVRSRDGVDLQIRVGLNSGEVVAGDIGSGPNTYTAVGHSVGMAQRMEAAAPPGGILCSLPTARLVEGAARLGPPADIVIKGSDIPVSARPLLGVESDRTMLGRNEGLMLGRQTELNWLRDIFDTGSGFLVGIVGSPGLGKSRLIREFTAIAASQGPISLLPGVKPTPPHRVPCAVALAARHVQGGGAQRRRGPRAHDGPVRRVAHTALCRRANPVRGHGHRRHQCTSTAGQRRWPTPPTGRNDGAGRPGTSARTVFVLEDAHRIDAPSDDVLADFAATLNVTTSMFVTTYRPEFHGALHHHADRRSPCSH